MAAVPSRGPAAPELAPEAVATRELYERYAAQVFSFCLNRLGSREEAEDAVQSTFLNAFRGLKRGVVPQAEAAWLFTIAQNVCLSRHRSTRRRGRVESAADFEIVQETTPAPAAPGDELVGLRDALAGMPETQRRAILLREWQGLSYREIADELELSQAAVETLIFRARRSLASGLEQPAQTETRRRVRRSSDLGNVLAGIKTVLVGGGAAAKVVATVAVVSATGIVASVPVARHIHLRDPSAPKPDATVATAAAVRPAVAAAPLAHAPARRAAPAPPRRHVAQRSNRAFAAAGLAAAVDETTAPAVTAPAAPPPAPVQPVSTAPTEPTPAPAPAEPPHPAAVESQPPAHEQSAAPQPPAATQPTEPSRTTGPPETAPHTVTIPLKVAPTPESPEHGSAQPAATTPAAVETTTAPAATTAAPTATTTTPATTTVAVTTTQLTETRPALSVTTTTPSGTTTTTRLERTEPVKSGSGS